jgi:hypothetical protein
MASPENRPAFRLPWQSGNPSGPEAASATPTAVAVAPAWPTTDLARRQNKTATPRVETTDAGDGTSPGDVTATAEVSATAEVTATAELVDAPETDGTAPDASVRSTEPETAMATDVTPAEFAAGASVEMRSAMMETATQPARDTAEPRTPRKPTKFLADLTRAMRQAADEARASALEQFQADVERHSESTRATCQVAAAQARQRADEDITALGEWETLEIARIRRETEEGINARHGRLEAELNEQTSRLDAELGRVHERVAAFQAEVDAFFQGLLKEEDPAHFAAMAEQLPEPPTFEAWSPSAGQPAAELTALQIWAESADTTPGWTADGELADPAAVSSTDTGMPAMKAGDFEAAEAEAAEWTDPAESSPDTDESVPTDVSTNGTSAADALDADVVAAPAVTRTQVAVMGLVSVASIATFKRLLAREAGIRSVQVASGPDGEFLFTAAHDEGVDMPAAVAGIQGFDIEVVDSKPGNVSARAVDPEAV